MSNPDGGLMGLCVMLIMLIAFWAGHQVGRRRGLKETEGWWHNLNKCILRIAAEDLAKARAESRAAASRRCRKRKRKCRAR